MSWHTIDEKIGLKTAEYRVPGLKSRTTAIALPDDTFLVYSPGTGLEQDFVEHVGEPTILLLCNNYHHLAVPLWKKTFPNAKRCAYAKAIPRLIKQGRTGIIALSDLKIDFPSHLSFMTPPKTRIGEVWMRIEAEDGVTWVIGDCFFNFPRKPKKFMPRMLQMATQGGPGLAMSQIMKWGGISDRRAFKSWILEKLDSDRPNRVIPVHGDILSGPQTAGRLRELVHRRL